MIEPPKADYRFPPMVPPVEHELRRIEAAALLLEVPCIHCNATTEALAGFGSLPRALGITHEKGCPNYCE
ncbi:hypothetical protein [Specibacter sp. RAF43]|uniref:hypothetical protein n=1 Tax=Specibacter sp. RAF43 TaxID=3233057 RepID=UPI003F9558B8